MDAKKTGAFIAQLRKEKRYTQKDLAQIMHVSDKTVSKWETGRGMPDTALLKPLSEVLGVSVGELLSGERMPEEEVRELTDAVIVETLRKPDKKMTVIAFIASVVAALVLILVLDLMPWQWRVVRSVRSDGYDLRINKLTKTITDGTTVCDYTVSEEDGNYFIAVTYPDGSTFSWSYYYRDRGKLVVDEQTSADYDESKYLPGGVLVRGLRLVYFMDFGSHASMEQVMLALWGIFLIPLGIAFILCREIIMERLFGWIYKSAELSHAGAVTGYILSIAVLTAGIVLLIASLY